MLFGAPSVIISTRSYPCVASAAATVRRPRSQLVDCVPEVDMSIRLSKVGRLPAVSAKGAG